MVRNSSIKSGQEVGRGLEDYGEQLENYSGRDPWCGWKREEGGVEWYTEGGRKREG